MEQVPSVSGAPNLRDINLHGCTNLIKVHNSIGLLDKLEILRVDYCTNLRIFPEVIHSTSLYMLDLTKCLNLPNFPRCLVTTDGMTNVDCGRRDEIVLNLRIEDRKPGIVYTEPSLLRFMPGIVVREPSTTLSCGLLMLPKLHKIMKGGSSVPPLDVRRLTFSFFTSKDKDLSKWPSCFSNMKELYLHGTNGIDEFLSTSLSWFHNLQLLDIFESNLTILPECIKECHLLRQVQVTNCMELREIKGVPTNIETLVLMVNKLTTLPECINECHSLSQLYLSRCEELREIKGMPTNIKILHVIRGNKLTILPECIKECHLLRELYLNNCKELREIRGMPPNIETIDATDCISLGDQPSSILLSQVQ